MRIEGLIEFEKELPFAEEAIGKTYNIQIAGYNGLLFTPSFPNYFLSERKLKGFDELIRNERSTSRFNNKLQWGSFCNLPIPSSSVKRCSMLFDIPEKYQQAGQLIFDTLASWRMLLLANASTLLLTDYRRHQQREPFRMNGAGEFELLVEENGEIKYFEYTNTEVLELAESRVPHFTSGGFQQVLDLTSTAFKPKLCYELFLDAERAISAQQWRKASLDIASTLEVALENVLEESIQIDPALKEYIMKEHNSLSRKRTLAKKMNIPIPRESEFKNTIESLRHDVIHKGRYPAEDQVAKAFQLLNEVLPKLVPSQFENIYNGPQNRAGS